MNKLCLTNNEGWSFVYNGERSVEVKDKFGIDYGEAPYIYLNDLTPDEMEGLERFDGIERERLITQLLQNRFTTLGSETATGFKKSTFHVQCYDYNSKPFVVFEKYGLQGGGRNQFFAFATGVAKVVFSVLIGVGTVASGGTTAPLLACGGAGLLSSGIGDMFYALKTPEKEITAKGYAAQTAIGFAAGAAGGVAGLGVNAVASQSLNTMVTTTLSGAASTAASTTAGTVTEAVIKNDARVLKRLTLKKLVASAAVGVFTGGVSSLSKGTVEAGSNLLFNSSSALATKTMVGAAAGAASSSAVKITENLINKYAFLKVIYETKPDDYLIEPGKLYIYVQRNEILFQSINANGQMIMTRITEQKQFLIGHEHENRFEILLAILKSKGNRNLSTKQKQFILESASKHKHVPVNLLNGVVDAVAVGASSGAAMGFTKAVADRWQTAAPIPRKDLEERKRQPHLIKRAKSERKEVLTTSKTEREKVEGGSVFKRRTVAQVKQTMPDLKETKETVQSKVTHLNERILVKRVRVETKVDRQGEAVVQKRKLEEGIFLKRRTVTQVKQTALKPKEADNSKATHSFLGKRVKVVTKGEGQGDPAVQKRKFQEGNFLKRKNIQQVNQTPKEEDSAKDDLNLKSKDKYFLRKRATVDQKSDKQDSKTQKEQTENKKNDEVCVLTPASSEQIKEAQQSINQANQKYTNLLTLSQYSAVDIENKANEIFNGAKNMRYYESSKAIPYIEKKLSEEFGIPMGTLTDSLKVAYKNKPDKYVPGPIISALTEKKNDGSAISFAKQNLDQAVQALQNLKDPKCSTNVPVGIPQTPLQIPPSFNILELVTDSENVARNSGYADNINVQMRYLTTRIVGADSGNLFDQVYTVFLNASFKWEVYRGEDKPTQYGLLTSVTDSLLNGKSTVPVEVKSLSWYQSCLSFVGQNGVGFQTDGANLQLGTMNNPNLVTVYSSASPQGIEGFKLPQNSSQILSTQPSTDGNPNLGLGLITSPQPAAVQPIAQATITNGTGIVSLKNPSKPSQPSVQGPAVSGSNPLPQHVGLDPMVYTAADTVQAVLKNLNNVPGLEGLGTYAGGAVGKVTSTLSTLERVADPDYQNEPFTQQVGCALWGTAIELVGQSPAVPLGGLAAVGVAAYLSEKASIAGDDAQQNCHDVINLFK